MTASPTFSRRVDLPAKAAVFAAALVGLAVGCERNDSPGRAGMLSEQRVTERDFDNNADRIGFIQQHVIMQIPHQARDVRFLYDRWQEWRLEASFELPEGVWDSFVGSLRSSGGGDGVIRRESAARGIFETIEIKPDRRRIHIVAGPLAGTAPSASSPGE